MAFDPEFLEMMTEEILLYRYTGLDKYGKSGHAQNPDPPIPCRIVKKTKFVRTPDGSSISSSTHITTGGYFGVDVKDKVMLPGDVAGGDPSPIVAVDSFPDEEGDHHQVIHLS